MKCNPFVRFLFCLVVLVLDTELIICLLLLFIYFYFHQLDTQLCWYCNNFTEHLLLYVSLFVCILRSVLCNDESSRCVTNRHAANHCPSHTCLFHVSMSNGSTHTQSYSPDCLFFYLSSERINPLNPFFWLKWFASNIQILTKSEACVAGCSQDREEVRSLFAMCADPGRGKRTLKRYWGYCNNPNFLIIDYLY